MVGEEVGMKAFSEEGFDIVSKVGPEQFPNIKKKKNYGI